MEESSCFLSRSLEDGSSGVDVDLGSVVVWVSCGRASLTMRYPNALLDVIIELEAGNLNFLPFLRNGKLTECVFESFVLGCGDADDLWPVGGPRAGGAAGASAKLEKFASSWFQMHSRIVLIDIISVFLVCIELCGLSFFSFSFVFHRISRTENVWTHLSATPCDGRSSTG